MVYHSQKEALKRIMRLTPDGWDMQIILEMEHETATRIAENQIQANSSIWDRTLWIEVHRDGREGLAQVNQIDDTAVKKAIDRAVQLAEMSEPGENWPGYAGPGTYREIKNWDRAIPGQSPADRARDLKAASELAQRAGCRNAGVYSVKELSRGIMNSAGLFGEADQTQADAAITSTDSSGSSGWARDFSYSSGDISAINLARKAVSKAVLSRNATALDPGEYTVILEPAAVGSMLLFLTFLSFGCQTVQRGTSMMAGKIGQRVLSDQITLVDDPFDLRSGGWPFDYQGVSARKLKIVDRGIAKSVVYDRNCVKAADSDSTGHALPPGNGFGPYPKCLHMIPGSVTPNQMLQGVDRGILVSRLWYINYANPMKTMITGTTRDGTFLIEKGKISRPVRNMRFVMSIQDAFSQTIQLTDTPAYVRQFGSTLCVPAMKIPFFTFTESV